MYQYILVDFLHKAYSKVDFGHAKISGAIFLGQSLLLSTTILNDMHTPSYIKTSLFTLKPLVSCYCVHNWILKFTKETSTYVIVNFKRVQRGNIEYFFKYIKLVPWSPENFDISI